MKPDFPILPFAIALFIGALIGLDREKRKLESGSTGVGGIRTFVLIAMAGAISAWLSAKFSMPWIFLVAGVCVTVIVMTGHAVYSIRNEASARGLTTEIAAFVTFLLGGLALFKDQQSLAVALGIAASAILAYKQPIHRVIGWLGEDDVHAVLKLLIATFVVLPVLPDHTVDHWGALNPYKMWWIVILISAMSLTGYVASRWLGERRALPLTGLFGGIVSSTVVSLEFSKRSRETELPAGGADALTSGVLFAWSVMFARIFIIVGALNMELLRPLVPSMAAMGFVTVALALIFMRRAARPADAAAEATATNGVPLKNPFSLKSAIKFAAFFALVLLVVKIIPQFLKSQGMYLVAGLAGLTDVDAISVSMSDYGHVPDQAFVAAMSIVVAAVSNTFVKLGFVLALGKGGIKPRMLLSTALILAAGAAAILAAKFSHA